jgi:hypothetical protein
VDSDQPVSKVDNLKVKESDMEKIFRLLREFIPQDEIHVISYCQTIDAHGRMDSTMKFERVVTKSSLNLSKNVKEHLEGSMPQALMRYCREWNIRDEHTHLRCAYDILIPNAPVIANLMERELFSKYSNEFHTELEKALKSK